MAALWVLALLAYPEQYQNLLLITPAIYSAPGFSLEEVEQFCEDEFLITYEIPLAKTAEAVHAVIGTSWAAPY